MKRYKVYQIDAFTKEKFLGNPAGVVTNADGLSGMDMQRIARELNNSETAFIFSSNSSDYDVHIRYFTPTTEVPICGHATIAAHYVRALELGLPTTRVYSKTGAGILPVDIIQDNGDYKIVMTQGRISFGILIEGVQRQTLFSALGIEESDLLKTHPIQVVSTGHSKVMIGIADEALLHYLKPDYGKLAALSKAIGCNGYYVYTVSPESDDVLVHGRMFAPAIGINEDPVTGNANGPLGAYLVHYGLVPHDGLMLKFKAMQGEAIGRTGVIEVAVNIKQEEPAEVSVSGNAVIVFRTEIEI